ncbi:MAG: hypothetical protein Q9222_002201 [Ikaeria aurantiellina]
MYEENRFVVDYFGAGLLMLSQRPGLSYCQEHCFNQLTIGSLKLVLGSEDHDDIGAISTEGFFIRVEREQRLDVEPAGYKAPHKLTVAPTEVSRQDFPPDDARAMSPRRSTEETDKMLVSARQDFPPDDGRALGPRRSTEETDKMRVSARQSIEKRAQDMQSGFEAIATQIESVSKNCESLDRQNQALQDTIGDMKKSLSRESLNAKKK